MANLLKRLQPHLKSPVKFTNPPVRRGSRRKQRSGEDEAELTPQNEPKKPNMGKPDKRPAATGTQDPGEGTSKGPSGPAAPAPQKLAPVGSEKWANAKNRKQKRNEKNRERKKRKQTQGPLHPYCVKVWADEAGEPLTLESWREILHKTKVNIIATILEDISLKNEIATKAIDEYKFVEHKPLNSRGEYEKTSHLPAKERKGHGLVLSFTKEGKSLAEKAFRLTGIDPATNKPTLGVEAPVVDTRAVFTFAACRYSWPAMIERGAIWHIAHHVYPNIVPSSNLNEVKSVKPSSYSEELNIIAIYVDRAWEKALDKLKGVLRLPIGTFRLKKRRRGAAPPEEEGDASAGEDEEMQPHQL